MPSVQVRDVPQDVVTALKRRADGRGESLQRYLLDMLTAEADIARNADLLDEAEHDRGYPAAAGEAVAELRQARASRDVGWDGTDL